MPVNKIYPLEKVMSALDHHLQITKRKVFIAYLLLNHERFSFTRSSPEKLKAFSDFLSAAKVNFTCRKSFGEDIQTACGQLVIGLRN